MVILCGLIGLMAIILGLSLIYIVSLPLYWLFNGCWPWEESRYIRKEAHAMVFVFGLFGYTILGFGGAMAVQIGCHILQK